MRPVSYTHLDVYKRQTHEYGKEAMMFLGDHWIGTEPFMPEFASIGLDAVVGSVGNGSTLRLISDIPGVKYTDCLLYTSRCV